MAAAEQGILRDCRMGDFDQAFVEALRRQSWVLYAVGIFMIGIRM